MLREQILVVREVRLVLVGRGRGLVEIGDKGRRSTSQEFSHLKGMADTNNILYLSASQNSK